MRIRIALLATLASLACDGGLQPEPGCGTGFVGVCGTVTLRGTVPDSTDGVFVLAYRAFPQTCDEIAGFLPFPPPQLTLGDTIATYALSLPDGRYEWILAAWKKVGQLTLTPADTALLREAGFYRDPANAANPGAVNVTGAGVDSIDFLVDLDNLNPITDYLTCTAQ